MLLQRANLQLRSCCVTSQLSKFSKKFSLVWLTTLSAGQLPAMPLLVTCQLTWLVFVASKVAQLHNTGPAASIFHRSCQLLLCLVEEVHLARLQVQVTQH
jgi:hypothetical protein